MNKYHRKEFENTFLASIHYDTFDVVMLGKYWGKSDKDNLRWGHNMCN